MGRIFWWVGNRIYGNMDKVIEVFNSVASIKKENIVNDEVILLKVGKHLEM